MADKEQGLRTGGLKTGSVEGAKGGLARDRIAASYEPDLSGVNGSRARFDATLELIQKEIENSNISFTSSGGVSVFGADGHFVVRSKKDQGRSGAFESAPTTTPYEPWGLEIVDAAEGEVRIKVGTIIADLNDLTEIVDITNATTVFTPSSGQRIWLQFDEVRPTEATLQIGTDWGDDSPYIRSGSDETLEMDSYCYELWEFADAGDAVSGWTPINADLYARRVAELSHFKITHTTFQSTGEYPLFVPILDSYHRARVV